MTRQRTIAVGVGGGATGWQTLAWAVSEASTAGGRILVCHVCPPDSALAVPGTHLSLAVLEVADPALSRAVTAARNRLGAHRVELRVHTGQIGEALVDAARTADLLVVGVDGSEPSRVALELGFAVADAHRKPLAAVHVTARDHEDYWFDDVMLETHLVAEPAGMALLAEQVEPWHHKYPMIAVKRALYGGRPLPGLLRAADGAHLLVVGDHGRGPAVQALLGSVSHGAVDRARCPVAIAHTYLDSR